MSDAMTNLFDIIAAVIVDGAATLDGSGIVAVDRGRGTESAERGNDLAKASACRSADLLESLIGSIVQENILRSKTRKSRTH
jgi:hypothetical protein